MTTALQRTDGRVLACAVGVAAAAGLAWFLAPLIVTEAEIAESVQCLERACMALSGDQLKKAAG